MGVKEWVLNMLQAAVPLNRTPLSSLSLCFQVCNSPSTHANPCAARQTYKKAAEHIQVSELKVCIPVKDHILHHL